MTTQVDVLLENGLPAPSVEVGVNEESGSHRDDEQAGAEERFSEDDLADAEKREVDEGASGKPVHQVEEAVVRRLDVGSFARNRSPEGSARADLSVEVEERLFRLRP